MRFINASSISGTTPRSTLFLTPRSASDTLRFAITSSGNGSEQRLDAAMVATNEWAHVAVVLAGDGGKLYVNGALVASNTVTLNPSSFNPAVNYLGKSQWPDPLFNGMMDDFQIYNRALSDFEVANLANPAIDSDADGFSDSVETAADTDGDGIPDYLDNDSDNDGVPDSAETFADTDGDGLRNIRDPDSDNDSLPDGWEVTYGLNPLNAADADADTDGDGQSNREEHAAGTQPNNASDYFTQTAVAGTPLTVSVNGVAGRTYILWRNLSLESSWAAVLTNGPVVADGPVLLVDPTPPGAGAFYRTSVSAP
ncbi:MAG: hypothetical protein QM813_25570 [Verrucomicrobiota bacterium]